MEIEKEFKTKQEFLSAALKIKFPGYGFGGVDSKENICNVAIEIPRKNADRYIIAIEKNGRWQSSTILKAPQYMTVQLLKCKAAN